MDIQDRFVASEPRPQHIVDLFQGEWSSKFPAGLGATTEPGHAALFADPRIKWANECLGPFSNLNVLELGPLEGAHTCMIEQAGAASVTAIESNTRAFLKCLCVKEIFGLQRSRFLLGDFLEYLEHPRRHDVVIASGVLYHMQDPLRLLQLLTKASDRIFLWTHYYDATAISRRNDHGLFEPSGPIGDGLRGSKRHYPEEATAWSGFSGGAAHYAIWLERASLLAYFRSNGFQVEVNFDAVEHVNGPSFALCVSR